MPQVISANRLDDGLVVYLGRNDAWVDEISGSEVFGDKAALATGLARAQAAADRNIIVDIAPVDVEIRSGAPAPTHLREQIRARGPTVRRDHGKQAVAG